MKARRVQAVCGVLGVALALAAAALAAGAEPSFGVHAGVWTDDGEPVVGVELVLGLRF